MCETLSWRLEPLPLLSGGMDGGPQPSRSPCRLRVEED